MAYAIYLPVKKTVSWIQTPTLNEIANRISLQDLFVYLFLHLSHKTIKTEEQERSEIWRS